MVRRILSGEIVSKLRSKVDIIIVLSHLGLIEGSNYTSKSIAENLDGVDRIVDGHSHTLLKRGLMVNNTLIVMAEEYNKNLGVVRLTVKDGKVMKKEAETISKAEAMDVVKDQEIFNFIKRIKVKSKEIVSEVIGQTEVVLNGEREQVRTEETNLCYLVTDSILATVEADCVFINGGSIRTSLPVGEISKGDIISVLPFNNYVVVKKMTGADILAAVEHGVSAYPATEGRFPQVSGISFIFNPMTKKRGI